MASSVFDVSSRLMNDDSDGEETMSELRRFHSLIARGKSENLNVSLRTLYWFSVNGCLFHDRRDVDKVTYLARSIL